MDTFTRWNTKPTGPEVFLNFYSEGTLGQKSTVIKIVSIRISIQKIEILMGLILITGSDICTFSSMRNSGTVIHPAIGTGPEASPKKGVPWV